MANTSDAVEATEAEPGTTTESKTTKSTKTTKAKATAEATAPAETAVTAETTAPAETAVTAETTAPAETVKTAEATAPAETVKTAEEKPLTINQLRITNNGARTFCHVSKAVLEKGKPVIIEYKSYQLKALAIGNFAQLNALQGKTRFVVEG